jgi:hypothetical protein
MQLLDVIKPAPMDRGNLAESPKILVIRPPARFEMRHEP